MAVGAGVSAQLMYKSEVTPGTAVVVDKGLELISETVKNDGGARIVSRGLRAGRLVNHRAARGIVTIAGPVVMEMPDTNIATWLKHMFGTVVTTGAGPYTHTYTPGDLAGDSMTVQIGRPDVSGTVQPFTLAGVKISEWELAAEVDQYAILTSTLSARTELTATALATASYAATTNPFVCTNAVLSGAGAPTNVNAFSIKGNNGLAIRAGTGSQAIREQIGTRRTFSGSITAEFESLARYADFIAATQRALVATFTSGANSFTVTMNIEYLGESPAVEGPDILTQPLPWETISATSDAAAITAVLISATDTTAA